MISRPTRRAVLCSLLASAPACADSAGGGETDVDSGISESFEASTTLSTGDGDGDGDGDTLTTGDGDGDGDGDGSICNGVIPVTIRDFRVDHPDMEGPTGAEDGLVAEDLGADKKPVYAGDPTSGTTTTTGQANFDQWYRDVAGTNKTSDFTLQLVQDPMNQMQWSFDTDAFYPLDSYGDMDTPESWGFEGNIHNYHFTMELHSRFTYVGGETFTFSGDDDVFLFINGKLAIDIGGVHGELSESVDLDAMATQLGITPGGMYDFDFFFAERHTSESNFHIDTSIGCFVIP